jgi:hypothetical protein
MGLPSFLVWARENVGNRDAVSPAAASVRVSRREMLLPNAESAAPDAVREKFIISLLFR